MPGSRITDITTLAKTPVAAAVIELDSLANGSEKILAAALRFDARTYGVDPSSADNASALQDAINAAQAAGGGIVTLPPGLLKVGSTCNITSPNVTIDGNDRASTLQRLSGTGTYAILGIQSSYTKVKGIVFDGKYTSGANTGDFGLIQIDGNSASPIQFVSVKDNTFINCIDKGIRVGGYITDLEVSFNIFKNHFCSLWSGSSSQGAPQRMLIHGNRFISNWGTGAYSGAIKLSVNTGLNAMLPEGHVITSNIISICGQMGIEVWGGNNHTIVGNNNVDTVDFGISIDSSNFCVVQGNRVRKVVTLGIELASCTDAIVESNVVTLYSSGTTRTSALGVTVSGSSPTRNQIIGNKVVGTTADGIHNSGGTYTVVRANTIYDCATCYYHQGGSHLVLRENIFDRPTGYHVFLDFNGGNDSDIDVSCNTFLGGGANDNILIYDGGNNRTVTNLVIRDNNIANSTWGNLSINYGIPASRLVNHVVMHNYYAPGGGSRSKFPNDQTTDVAMPYLPGSQWAGISCSRKIKVTIPADNVNSHWFKIFSKDYGNPIFAQFHILQSDGSNGNQSRTYWVSAAPYGRGSCVTLLPMGDFFGGSVKEVIYNNLGNGSVHEIWIKTDPQGSAGSLTIYVSDFEDDWINNPGFVTTQPTWDSNYKANSQVDYQTFATKRLEARAGIASFDYVASVTRNNGARLHITGDVDSTGKTVRFDKSDGTEAFNVDSANGQARALLGLEVGGGSKMVKVLSATGSVNFPSINGGAENTQTVTVTGVTTSNTPVVMLGWDAALEDGIVVKQAWVSANDTVSIRVRNVTAGAIDPAARTCRATVITY